MTEQTWLWLGFAGMAVGALAIFVIGDRKTPKEELATILHGIVPIIAACSYFAMAVGQGSVMRHSDVGGGIDYNFYFARYIDWLFTTPLLLVALSTTAMHASLRRPGLLVGIVVSDVIMIVTALLFGLSGVAWIKWSWFAISCGAFLAVYYVIYGGLREEADLQREDVRGTFMRNAAYLSVVWFVYPIVLLVDPEGLNLISSATSVALFTVIDLVAKVGYGLIASAAHGRIAERDLRINEASASMARRLA